MVVDKKYHVQQSFILRDTRSIWTRIADALRNSSYSSTFFFLAAVLVYMNDWALAFADLILLVMLLYWSWLAFQEIKLPFKMPQGAKIKDPNEDGPGRDGTPSGILYMGNDKESNQEIWFTNSDIRTHMLYLGTTGSGKTEGLKAMATNALTWSSGFVYIDGKADTDLWSSLSALVRRFGRDDDLLVLNYMTGNIDGSAPSHTMNPFSSGSASYLTNMLVSLMPEAEGDNAMWKERAVALCSALMPVLTWKRDNQDMELSIKVIRDSLELNKVIKYSRDEAVPEKKRDGLVGYLGTLPGYEKGDAYDDEGNVKPPGPNTPQYDTTTTSQQHGYLAMQFTRALQSLGDDYGYIFDTQAADVDMVDVVLNRRILVVLIPALEKSGDEIANLGKIISASLKGMMGSTLGATVEGTSEKAIENKPTKSSTPFITIFDEVGYYTAQGMAVMAAQARSLGFCLIFASQDLPSMKKRVREEANSITANCNIKIFGKLEDPTETKEFFEKSVGSIYVSEVGSFEIPKEGMNFGGFQSAQSANVKDQSLVSYEGVWGYKEGDACITFGSGLSEAKIFYANPGFAKAMRVTRFMALPPLNENLVTHSKDLTKLRDLLMKKGWSAEKSAAPVKQSKMIDTLIDGYKKFDTPEITPIEAGIASVVEIYAMKHPLPQRNKQETEKPKADPIVSSDVTLPKSEKKVENPIQSYAKEEVPQEILDILETAASKARKKMFKERKSSDAAK